MHWLPILFRRSLRPPRDCSLPFTTQHREHMQCVAAFPGLLGGWAAQRSLEYWHDARPCSRHVPRAGLPSPLRGEPYSRCPCSWPNRHNAQVRSWIILLPGQDFTSIDMYKIGLNAGNLRAIIQLHVLPNTPPRTLRQASGRFASSARVPPPVLGVLHILGVPVRRLGCAAACR